MVAEAAGHGEGVAGVSFTPDGEHVISGSFDATMRIWEVQQQ
jgi:WD40 repeat protein